MRRNKTAPSNGPEQSGGLRSRCSTAATIGSVLLSVAAITVLVLLLVGRILTDTRAWSQFLFWVPPELLAGLCLGLLTGSGLLLMFVPRRRRLRRRRNVGVSRGLFRTALLLAGVALLWLTLWHWRLYRFPERAGDAAPGSAVIMHWNVGPDARRLEPSAIASVRPDIAILVNPPRLKAWRDAIDAVEGVEHRWTGWRWHVLSEYPILEVRPVSLRLRGRRYQGLTRGSKTTAQPMDSGAALMLHLDTRDLLGRNLVLWVLDLPSDPMLVREEIGRLAAERMHQMGFAEPDVILGDMNTARRGSLDPLTGDLRNAFALAGMGRAATWPRVNPLLHLDQAFVSDRIRTLAYRIRDTGIGQHRAQVLEVGPVGGE